MMVGACELLFLVPSLVRPLQRYVFSTATSRIFGADLDFADQFSAVFYHGLGVLTLDRFTGELSVVRDLSPRAVMIDVATNNLSHADIDSVSWVLMIYHVCMVYRSCMPEVILYHDCLQVVTFEFCFCRIHIDGSLSFLQVIFWLELGFPASFASSVLSFVLRLCACI